MKMDENTRELEQRLRNIAFDDAIDPAHKDLLEQKLILHFPAAQPAGDFAWRRAMKSRIARYALAAIVLIGVFANWQFIDGTSSMAWAQVLDQVAGVKAVVYKARIDAVENGQPAQVLIEATLADEYGTRMDVYRGEQLVGRFFTLEDRRKRVILFPEKHKYIEVDLTEKNRLENGDPKLIVEAFLKGDYKKLGKREINGVSVKGIQSHDVLPSAGFPGGGGLGGDLDKAPVQVVGSLWVDLATGWPVEITLEISDQNGDKQTTIVVSDFQWDAQIDPATFASIIPPGYELMYKVDAMNLEEGQQLVDGLQYFAELNDGKYPGALSVRGVVMEIGGIYQAKKGDPSFGIDDGKVSTLKYGAQFYETLQAEGKEAVYNGADVTAKNADQVLIRWKLNESQYRVIFGDLRVEDVTAARLQQLEAE